MDKAGYHERKLPRDYHDLRRLSVGELTPTKKLKDY